MAKLVNEVEATGNFSYVSERNHGEIICCSVMPMPLSTQYFHQVFAGDE